MPLLRVTNSSAAQVLTGCGDQIDAIYQECVTANPSFGVAPDDFSAALAGAVEKYADCIGPRGSTSVRKVRQFIKELQLEDLYLALA